MRGRAKQGSVVLDRRIKTWNFFYWQNGKRHSKKIGTLEELPSKTAAWKAAKALRDAVEQQQPIAATVVAVKHSIPTVNKLVEQYRAEKMPKRFSTSYGYNAWLDNHVMPRWGQCMITDLQARPVEMWLHSLVLAPKSLVHVRGMLRTLWDYAMWRGEIPTQRNPMELVTIKGATKRNRQPRSLTADEFLRFSQNLREPFRTIALVCVCLGLRISECLALKWADVDWLDGRLTVERGIVRQRVGETKTAESRKRLNVSADLLEVLKTWKQATQFGADDDWLFASPAQIGRLPWSYPRVWQVFQETAERAGIGKLGTHTMRHTYRAWLDAVGTSLAVQQKLMRHADIRTTMNVYGDVVTNEMTVASGKVSGMALNGRCERQVNPLNN
jgi:integrase